MHSEDGGIILWMITHTQLRISCYQIGLITTYRITHQNSVCIKLRYVAKGSLKLQLQFLHHALDVEPHAVGSPDQASTASWTYAGKTIRPHFKPVAIAHDAYTTSSLLYSWFGWVVPFLIHLVVLQYTIHLPFRSATVILYTNKNICRIITSALYTVYRSMMQWSEWRARGA